MKLASLSYSGASTLAECERKYFHKYIVRTPKDTDYETPDYFSLGNAFHKCLELTKHDPKAFSDLNFNEIIKSYGLDVVEDGGRVMAMLRKYWILHTSIPLDVRACEVKFEGTYTNGVIDAIMVESGAKHQSLSGTPGAWWIVDMKSAGKADVNLPARLKNDPQLNLYANFRSAIASLVGVDPELFAGVRYREVTKPAQKYKAHEEFSSWTSRCSDGAQVREIVIPAAELDHVAAYEDFSEAISRAHALQIRFAEKNEVVGKCNYRACLNYFRPCEYFSRCYGKTYTESLHSTKQTVVDSSGKVFALGNVSNDMSDLLNEFSSLEDEFC